MTPETRKTLLDLITEYGNALTRIQGEKEHLRAIETRAANECVVEIKAFKAVAAAYWADKTETAREDLEAILEVFEVVSGPSERVTVEICDVA